MSKERLTSAVKTLQQVLVAVERKDLSTRVTAAAARVSRPGTVVTVVGEFKQGKSSLVNGLVRRPVCPVDDDLATATITLVRHGEPGAVVRRTVDGKTVSVPIAIGEVGDWVSEQGNPMNHKQVERVDISLPSPFLENGLTIVDTPGMGGLGAGHAAATMAFLPFADGLVLVSDASNELSQPEVDFLRQATEMCPTVMLVQTKTDLSPQWRRIIDINRGHLAEQGITIPIVAASNVLRTAALRSKDRDLNARSGFTEVIDTLEKQVIEPAQAQAERRSRNDLQAVSSLVRSGLESELSMLENPEELEATLAELNESTERLTHLRGPGAKWSQLLGDRISDMSTSVSHRFRGDMRRVSRAMDERIEELKKGSEWEEIVRDLQTEVAQATSRAFASIQQGWIDTYAEVAELIDEEHLTVPLAESKRGGIDVAEFWTGSSRLDHDEKKALEAVKSVVGLGQNYGSSKILLGNVGSLSKFGVSLGALATGPFIAGGFAVMGAMKIADDRKRKLTQRRQKARADVRQYCDDVQFEVNNEITLFVRDAQRDMRDEFGDRLKELQTTLTETIKRAQADAKKSHEEIGQRKEKLNKLLEVLSKVDAALGSVGQ